MFTEYVGHFQVIKYMSKASTFVVLDYSPHPGFYMFRVSPSSRMSMKHTGRMLQQTSGCAEWRAAGGAGGAFLNTQLTRTDVGGWGRRRGTKPVYAGTLVADKWGQH